MQHLIEIKNLTKDFPIQSDFLGKSIGYTRALNNLSLSIGKGEVVAIAGESGCGKTTLGRCIMLLEKPTDGVILYNNKNILNLEKNDLKEFKKHAQLIFQNPYASLNPKMTIYEILKEPLMINKISSKEISSRIEETIEFVGLNLTDLSKYPHEFSGGQRQRIAIARALVLRPEFIIADEPVSALDVSIQAQIINLLLELKEKLNLTVIFISHDLGVIRQIADRVAVMYLGEIVEIGLVDEVFDTPSHPYTKLLLASVPTIKKFKKEPLQNDPGIKGGEISSEFCNFYERCPMNDENCKKGSLCLKELTPTHFVRCLK